MFIDCDSKNRVSNPSFVDYCSILTSYSQKVDDEISKNVKLNDENMKESVFFRSTNNPLSTCYIPT